MKYTRKPAICDCGCNNFAFSDDWSFNEKKTHVLCIECMNKYDVCNEEAEYYSQYVLEKSQTQLTLTQIEDLTEQSLSPGFQCKAIVVKLNDLDEWLST